jgi:hypothetical protein
MFGGSTTSTFASQIVAQWTIFSIARSETGGQHPQIRQR